MVMDEHIATVWFADAIWRQVYEGADATIKALPLSASRPDPEASPVPAAENGLARPVIMCRLPRFSLQEARLPSPGLITPSGSVWQRSRPCRRPGSAPGRLAWRAPSGRPAADGPLCRFLGRGRRRQPRNRPVQASECRVGLGQTAL